MLGEIPRPLWYSDLQLKPTRVDTSLKMSSPPAHLSHRTLLPGALLALLVTSAALLALAVVIAVGPDGPARLWLDGGGSTVNLEPLTDAQAAATGAAALSLPGSPIAFLTAAPTAGAKGAVTLAASPRTTARLRGNTRVQRRTGRVPAAGRPSQPATPGTAPTTPVSTPAAATPRPVSTPAPGSTVVKTRGHAKDTGSSPVAVRRERVRLTAPAPSAAGAPAAVGPASTSEPAVDTRPTHPPAEPDTGAGVLRHVPPPHPSDSGG
jgi:hypothetical protein